MPRAQKGIFIQCDPAVCQIILNMEELKPGIILEVLDEEHLMITEKRFEEVLKQLEARFDENTYLHIET